MNLEEEQSKKDIPNNSLKKTGDFSDNKYSQISFPENKNKDYNVDNQIKNDNTKRNKNIKKEVKKDAIQLQINTSVSNEEDDFEGIQDTVKKQSTKKKKLLNLLFLFINISVVAGILTYQILNENALTSINEISSMINWGVIVLLVVLFFLITFLESLKFWILIQRTTKKSRFALSYKVYALGRYYDNITPFATGGEPFQVFYLNNRGVPAAEALSIPMARYVFWQLSFSIFSLIVMLFSISVNSTADAGTTIVTAGSWIGFAINSALLLIVGIISISKKIGTKIVTGILKFLNKIKIVKNYEKQYNKTMKLVNEYQNTMRKYAKEGWAFASMILLTFLNFIIHYSLPFFIYASFFNFNWSIFTTIFVYGLMTDLASGFFPLPGGTGVAELSFTALFGLFFVDGTIFWAMIIWRVLTYYAHIIHGLIVMIYDYLIGNKRFEWEKKKWALESESRIFEEAHLKEFETKLKITSKKNKRRKK